MLDGEALCVAAEVEPTQRAEQLTVEAFCALARARAPNFTAETP